MPKIWKLPKGCSRAGLHASHDELGLNLPTIWEDYYSAAINSWARIIKDQGALMGRNTRLSNPGRHQVKKLATRTHSPRSQGRHTTLPLHHRPQHRYNISCRPTSPRGPIHFVRNPILDSTHQRHTYHNRRRRLPHYQPTLHTNISNPSQAHPLMGTHRAHMGTNDKTISQRTPLLR
jgi:hypothetical protein